MRLGKDRELATQVACPVCKGLGAKNIGDGVIPCTQGNSVVEKPFGKLYRCLRCGAPFTVTPGETFSPKAPYQEREQNGSPRGIARINPDLITSPDDMP